MKTQIKEPKIGDMVKIVYLCYGVEKITLGIIEGYKHNDFGDYVVLSEQRPIFMQSIKHWELLKSLN